MSKIGQNKRVKNLGHVTCVLIFLWNPIQYAFPSVKEYSTPDIKS